MSGKISILAGGIHRYLLADLTGRFAGGYPIHPHGPAKRRRQHRYGSRLAGHPYAQVRLLACRRAPAGGSDILANGGKSRRTPAKALSLTVELVFDDQSADQQFTGCPATNLTRIPFMVAGPPGEPLTFPVDTPVAAKFSLLNAAADSGSVYAHGCVRYYDVMTNLERLTEFCVRYYGGDNYEMCDNSNLMD
jgi:hypothetical protein